MKCRYLALRSRKRTYMICLRKQLKTTNVCSFALLVACFKCLLETRMRNYSRLSKGFYYTF